MPQENNFYVYAYVRKSDSPIAGTPYYIGKGKGDRAYLGHLVTVPSKDRIIFLEQNLTNVGALAIERRLIRWYGRKDLGTGILLNRTDGGDGNTNVRLPESQKLKMSETHKRIGISSDHMKKMIQGRVGLSLSDKHKKSLSENHVGMSGQKHSDETKKKMSMSKKNKPISDLHRQKLVEAWKRRKEAK